MSGGFRDWADDLEIDYSEEMEKAAKNENAWVLETSAASHINECHIYDSSNREAKQVNGWIRLNASTLLGKRQIFDLGFELMLNFGPGRIHSEYLEHIRSVDVVDTAETYRHGRETRS